LRDPFEDLVVGAQQLGIHLTPAHVKIFDQFLALLLDWNSRINLTAIRHPHDIIIKHFLDSLTIYPHLPKSQKPITILDVGTGAGFPGIPLAIMLPDARFTLLDSTQKKIRFLETAVNDIGLQNVRPLWGRADTLTGYFDAVTARAMGDVPHTLEATIPHAIQNGFIILPRGPKDDSADVLIKKQAVKLGAHVLHNHHFTLPVSGDHRTIWVLQKNKP